MKPTLTVLACSRKEYHDRLSPPSLLACSDRGGHAQPSEEQLPSKNDDPQHMVNTKPINEEQEHEASSAVHASGPAAIFAALTRSLVLPILKRLGVSLAVLRGFLRKRTFLYLTRQTAQYSPIYADSIERAAAAAKNASTSQTKARVVAGKIAVFLKSSIAGVAVFGIYDALVYHKSLEYYRQKEEKDENRHEKTWNRETQYSIPIGTTISDQTLAEDVVNDRRKVIYMEASVYPDKENPTSRLTHFLAGGMAGLVQSLFLDAWEVGAYWISHRDYFRQQNRPSGSLNEKPRLFLQHFWNHDLHRSVNYHLIVRRAIHYCAGYSVMFGTYESVRRTTVSGMLDYLASGDPTVSTVLEVLTKWRLVSVNAQTGVYDMTVVPMAAAFCAGGIAGQTHFVVNHYTRHWTLQVLAPRPAVAQATEGLGQDSSPSVKQKSEFKSRLLPKPPSVRSIANAFFPTALCFLAFQYGGELMEHWLESETETARRSFPVYICGAT